MAENRTRIRAYTSDPGGFDDDYPEASVQPEHYSIEFGRSAGNDDNDEPSVPLFLSDPDGEPDPEEYTTPLRKRGLAAVSSKILMAVIAASGAAMLFAWFSSDGTRNIIVNAKASIVAAIPTPSATAEADAAQLTPGDLQLTSTHGGSQAQATAPAPIVVANAAPSREEIASAYQNALQAHAPAAVTTPPVAPAVATPTAMPQAPAPQVEAPQPKRIDPQELAMLMKRARDMLASGDIPAARLFLERAADGQDPTAALMLARTYDPTVLGTSDVRSITPEPDKARAWYQKAAQLGSADAQQRLAQLPN